MVLLHDGASIVLQVVSPVVNALLSAANGVAVAALYIELRRAGAGGLAVETAEAFA